MMGSFLLVGVYLTMTTVIVLLWFAKMATSSLPQVVQDVLLYGKARGSRKEATFVQAVEIPKRWFVHFYIIGFGVSLSSLTVTIRSYLYGIPPPVLLTDILQRVTDQPKTASMDELSTLILLCMMLIQHVRRLLECLYVSVYSKGTMNVAHYLLGVILYTTFPLTVLTESTELTSTIQIRFMETDYKGWMFKLSGIGLFTVASYLHNLTHRQLAQLRKNKKDTERHFIPKGGLFEYISSPHMLMEILIYTSFALTSQCQSMTLILGPVLFTVCNQCASAQITHAWYRQQFKTYPKTRYALIPGIF